MSKKTNVVMLQNVVFKGVAIPKSTVLEWEAIEKRNGAFCEFTDKEPTHNIVGGKLVETKEVKIETKKEQKNETTISEVVPEPIEEVEIEKKKEPKK